MESSSEGKETDPNKGTLIAFDRIPKQEQRDELEESYGFEIYFNSTDEK